MIEPLVYGDCTSPTKIIDTINLCVRALNAMEAANTSTNKQSTQLCDDCAVNKVAVSVCEPCLLKMIHHGA